MSVVIWKEKLDPLWKQEIRIPAGAQFLCAREQGDLPHVWFVCSPDVPKETRTIIILGTGQVRDDEVLDNTRYLGTCFMRGADLVLHVFEQIKHLDS